MGHVRRGPWATGQASVPFRKPRLVIVSDYPTALKNGSPLQYVGEVELRDHSEAHALVKQSWN